MGKRAVEVSGEFWQEICTKGWSAGHPDRLECVEGLPEDATFVAAYYEQREGLALPIVVFVFEHPDWPEGISEYAIPYINVGFKQTVIDA